jgi:outer membrane immunogenic protein
MKKMLLSSVGVLALGIATQAVAADLAPRPYKAEPVAVASVYNWTGFYIGVNGGYGWGDQDPLTLSSNRFDRTSFSLKGGMFGGTFGAQIQQGYVVIGFEGDLDWANISGNGVVTPTIAGIPQGITLNIDSKMSAVATARARVGVAMNNWLFYGTGGVASVKSTASDTSIAGVTCGTLGVLPNCAGSAWRPGFAAGLGAEWGFAQNWSLKAEYLYIATLGTGVSTNSLNTVRGGINYRF